PKLKRGRARRHFEPFDVSEYVENFLRHAVREVALIALRREVRKGEYRDGCGGRRWRHRGSLRAGLRAMLAGATSCAPSCMLYPAFPPQESAPPFQPKGDEHQPPAPPPH